MAGERTKEEILALADINPEYEERLKEQPPPKMDEVSVLDMRKMMDDFARDHIKNEPVPDGVHEEEMSAPARDGYEIPVCIHRPSNGTYPGPLVVMLHGGDYVLGGPWQENESCREFVLKFGAVCVNVDYRLAPEHAFPVPLHDSYDALKWAAAHAQELGADPSKGFIIAGTSGGASMANVCAHLAKDEKLAPPLTGLYLCVPQVIATGEPPEKYKEEYLSWEQNKDEPMFTRALLEKFYENWKPDRSSPLYDAIRLDHKGLPRVYIQACGRDIFRDDALLFEKILRVEAGVETKIDVYPGLPHGFWLFAPDLDVSKRCLADITQGVA